MLAPLLASIVAGLFGKWIGRAGAHTVTIAGVAISCALSFKVLYELLQGAPVVRRPGLHLARQRRHPHGRRLPDRPASVP